MGECQGRRQAHALHWLTDESMPQARGGGCGEHYTNKTRFWLHYNPQAEVGFYSRIVAGAGFCESGRLRQRGSFLEFL